MRNPFSFFLELAQQPVWLPLWVSFLMLVNLVSAVFWSEPIAKLILGAFIVSSMLMMALYSKFGLTRILGLGHALWVPLLLHALRRLPHTTETFKAYLIAWCIATTVSLAFDVVDVWKYFMTRKQASSRE